MFDVKRIPPPSYPDVRLRTTPNWTAVLFLALLGGVHLAIAVPATLHGRWEGYLSYFFAVVFAIGAFIVARMFTEIALMSSRREIRLRTGTRRWHVERLIPFDAISAVRLTLITSRPRESRIDIICVGEDIECPPTDVPCEEGLLFAMMIGVTLIKVQADESQNATEERSSSQHVQEPLDPTE